MYTALFPRLLVENIQISRASGNSSHGFRESDVESVGSDSVAGFNNQECLLLWALSKGPRPGDRTRMYED